MKKLVAACATTSVIALGMFATNVSAAEYEVQKNDNLWGIAQQYGTSVQQLVNANELDSTMIHPGQVIHTENEATEKADTDDSKNTEVYKVEAGDTLSGISLKYGVTVDEIQDWNNLSKTMIFSGQDLKLKGIEANTSQSEESSEPKEDTSQPEESSQAEESVETAEDTSQAEESSKVEEPAKEVETTSTKEKEKTETKATEETKNVSNDKQEKSMSVTATAYTAKCEGCSGVTATGIDLNKNPDKKVIAVDPDVIPLGSEVYVEGYGKAIAGDTGGAIQGKKIDLHVPTKSEANSWGVQSVNITVLD